MSDYPPTSDDPRDEAQYCLDTRTMPPGAPDSIYGRKLVPIERDIVESLLALAAESSAAQYLREREVLEGALRRISYMTYGDLLDPTEPWHDAMERIARDALSRLASLPSPEPTQGEQ